ncbi:calcium channel flower homolog [Tubulanus polymorphus]|uniref:calcium channel flower homolog n=1 Tax=Tubulanus polymorphus TaxID=672921 RepID=UPI003DA5296C
MGQSFQRPSAEGAGHPSNPQVSWWMRTLARGLGTIGGVIALCTGVWACVTVTPRCLIAGILQMLFGFALILCESPCCCPFLDFVDSVTKFVDNRAYWQKAIVYVLLGVIPPATCIGVATGLGGALIIGTGVVYGIMSLGKKGYQQELRMKASKEQADPDMKVTLVENEGGNRVDLVNGQNFPTLPTSSVTVTMNRQM